jgi:putative spermidine/putrescine transport system substrate-binding protein
MRNSTFGLDRRGRLRRYFVRSALAAFACVPVLADAPLAWAQSGLTIANYGGTAGQASSEAIWKPIARDLKITIKEDTLTGVADVRNQVKAGAVQWDIIEFTTDECAVGAKEGLFEKLNKAAFEGFEYTDTALTDHYVLINSASYVIAWNKKKFGDNGPKTWADFWDVKKFPGSRSLRNSAVHNVEAALMADGVAPDKVYPIDLDRAFKKLEEIKPHIRVWWSSGGQAAQLARDEEVDLIAIWNTRLQPIIDAGGPYGFTWNGGILIADCYAIPKGARNAELAQKVLPIAASPKYQAEVANAKPISPVSPKAYKIGVIKPEMLPMLPMAPQNLPGQVEMQGPWWADRGADVQRRWLRFIQN